MSSLSSSPCLVVKLNVPWLVLEEAISNLILSSDVPLARVPSALCEPELFTIAPSERVSKVKAVSLTISASLLK